MPVSDSPFDDEHMLWPPNHAALGLKSGSLVIPGSLGPNRSHPLTCTARQRPRKTIDVIKIEVSYMGFGTPAFVPVYDPLSIQ